MGFIKMDNSSTRLSTLLVLLFSLLLLSVFTSQLLFASGVYTADKHINAGLDCESCHGVVGVAVGAEVGMTNCLICHGPHQKLEKLTENMRFNPHSDSHYGYLGCNECHHGHRADENFCGACHKE